MDVNTTAFQLVEAKKKAGYAVCTALTQYRDKYFPVVLYFETHGSKEWSEELSQEYRAHLKRRADANEIGDSQYRRLLFGLDELEEFRKTGKLLWPFRRKKEGFSLSPYYERIKNEFLQSEDFHPNTRGDIIWICDRYFSWLQINGYRTLKKVDAEVIQEYLRISSLEMKATSLYNIRLYMRKLYVFLFHAGYSCSDYALLFSFRVSRERPQQPAADPEEVRLTISAIDRNTQKGKRDYAIILLGAVLGMRAGDIIHLKLKDVDWANGEIRFCQSKNTEPVVLPLTQEVGKALKCYILEGRPDCDYEEVFIRMSAPRQPFVDGSGIQFLYREYRRKAGLSREAFDGKNFHSLRRAVGKNMITSGVPVTTVAQVIGHANVNSTKKYIALDSTHLKECALDFSGIEVTT